MCILKDAFKVQISSVSLYPGFYFLLGFLAFFLHKTSQPGIWKQGTPFPLSEYVFILVHVFSLYATRDIWEVIMAHYGYLIFLISLTNFWLVCLSIACSRRQSQLSCWLVCFCFFGVFFCTEITVVCDIACNIATHAWVAILCLFLPFYWLEDDEKWASHLGPKSRKPFVEWNRAFYQL